ncbi:MAG: YccF domain-containing protein [Gammaproteobacteria bacterium]
MLRFLGNLVWFVFGGCMMGLGWWLSALLCFVTIVGIPWGRACFNIGLFTFIPFGREAVNRRELYGSEDLGTGALGTVGNLFWLVFMGWWLALGHLFWGIVFCVTILGIPFGVQHFKLAGVALWPVGKAIVTVEQARAARQRHAG